VPLHFLNREKRAGESEEEILSGMEKKRAIHCKYIYLTFGHLSYRPPRVLEVEELELDESTTGE